MEFRANYVKLNEIGTEFNNTKEEIIDTINDILNDIDKLSNGWQASSYEMFRNKSDEYIDNLNSFAFNIDYIGDFIIKAKNRYSSNDEEWASKVKKVNAELEGEVDSLYDRV